MPNRSPEQVLDDLQRDVRRLIRLTTLALVFSIACVLALVAGGYKVYHDARQTHDALCTFRDDLQRRVDSTRDYLDQHPEGFPGVPPKVLTDQIRNQQRAIDALRNLNC